LVALVQNKKVIGFSLSVLKKKIIFCWIDSFYWNVTQLKRRVNHFFKLISTHFRFWGHTGDQITAGTNRSNLGWRNEIVIRLKNKFSKWMSHHFETLLTLECLHEVWEEISTRAFGNFLANMSRYKSELFLKNIFNE
jgi:hypothetical protein